MHTVLTLYYKKKNMAT